MKGAVSPSPYAPNSSRAAEVACVQDNHKGSKRERHEEEPRYAGKGNGTQVDTYCALGVGMVILLVVVGVVVLVVPSTVLVVLVGLLVIVVVVFE